MPYSFARQATGEVILHTDINELQIGIEANARRSATYIVAASNATQAEKDGADYVCDGTADDVEIQAAINALPANDGSAGYTNVTGGGGKVLLTAGKFNLATGVTNNEKDHVVLEGSGMGATALYAVTGFTGTFMVKFDRAADNRPAQLCGMRHIRLNGGGFGTGVHGIYIRCARSYFDHLHVTQMTGNGLEIHGATGPRWGTYDLHISYCLLMANAGVGMFCGEDNAEDAVVSYTRFAQNGVAGTPNAGHGLHIKGSAWQVSNCMSWGNHGRGILIEGTVGRCLIIGNKIEQNNGGIYTAYTTSGPTEVLINGNSFSSNGWDTENTYDDIQLNGSGGAPYHVLIANNLFHHAYAGNKSRYAIYIPANSERVFISNNSFADNGSLGSFGSGIILNSQTYAGTAGEPHAVTIRNNNGYMTENGGVSTQTPGAVATVNIAHGLSITPSHFSVTSNDTDARGAPSMHVTADATNVILNFSANLTAAVAYQWSWFARYI